MICLDSIARKIKSIVWATSLIKKRQYFWLIGINYDLFGSHVIMKEYYPYQSIGYHIRSYEIFLDKEKAPLDEYDMIFCDEKDIIDCVTNDITIRNSYLFGEKHIPSRLGLDIDLLSLFYAINKTKLTLLLKYDYEILEPYLERIKKQ